MKYLSQPIANSTNSKMHLVELQHKLMEAQGKFNDDKIRTYTASVRCQRDIGKTVYVGEDGIPHLHKTNKQGSSTVVTTAPTITEPTSIKIINAKLDRIVSLRESQHQSKV
jgi:hypothetical protein